MADSENDSINSKDALRIRILLASDPHESYENLNLLSQIISNEEFDFCIAPGDFLTVKGNELSNPSEEARILQLKQLSDFLQVYTTKIHKETIWIPGNHDGKFPFTDVTVGTNLHGRIMSLGCGLSVIGFGGSLPAYISGKEIWSGFPYMNENDLKQAFQSTDSLLDACDDQIIFLTHVGPNMCGTTSVLRKEGLIMTGSETIREAILKYKQKIVVNIHGHVHDCPGQSVISSVPVVNPGSMKQEYGNYAFITLQRQDKNSPWYLDEATFRKLPNKIPKWAQGVL